MAEPHIEKRWENEGHGSDVGRQLHELAVRASIGDGTVTLSVEQALAAADHLLGAGRVTNGYYR